LAEQIEKLFKMMQVIADAWLRLEVLKKTVVKLTKEAEAPTRAENRICRTSEVIDRAFGESCEVDDGLLISIASWIANMKK
jgi:hypothetical protein